MKIRFKTVGIIKESGFKFDRWLHILFCAIDIRIKNRLFTTYFLKIELNSGKIYF
jgi:hypothetical protein